MPLVIGINEWLLLQQWMKVVVAESNHKFIPIKILLFQLNTINAIVIDAMAFIYSYSFYYCIVLWLNEIIIFITDRTATSLQINCVTDNKNPFKNL